MERDRAVGGMTDSVFLTQGFICTDTELSGLSIPATTFGGRPEGELVVCLQDDAGVPLIERRFDLDQIEDDSILEIFWDEPIQNTKGRHYTILLYCITDRGWEDAVSFFIGHGSVSEEAACLNGTLLEGPIVYIWYGRRVQW